MNKAYNYNLSYIGLRTEVQGLIPNNTKSILDVGCSNGNLGAAIKLKTGARVVGIELSSEMGEVARKQIDEVHIGNAEALLSNGTINEKFEVIIFADILEHLVDPWETLQKSLKLLEKNGSIIASIPNVRHVNTLYNLLIKGYWPYNERGIRDKTHLRFFTKKNIEEMFDNDKLEIELLDATYRIIDKPCWLNLYARKLSVFWLKNIFTSQYLVRAKIR